MNPAPQPAVLPVGHRFSGIFAGAFGAFLGLALIKFGNPPIMEKWVSAPQDIYEFVVFTPWPVGWAYRLLAGVTVLGMLVGRWHRQAPRWLIALPLVWVVWQMAAATQSVDTRLSGATIEHLAAGIVCFYLGYFSLGRLHVLWPFWLGLGLGFAVVLAVGLQQQFGGLEASRRYFFLYYYPKMQNIPPEYIKKIESGRIFSTLFYPNALAGAMLLLLPAMLAGIMCLHRWFTIGARRFLLTAVGLSALACLYWSRSKGGWLLMLLLGLIALLRMPLAKKIKTGLVLAVLVAGLAGFLVKYIGFFQKGATSVSARFDYWQAAVQTARDHPLFGTGPGTFAIPYERIKRPESEMTRLVHNDYLEQASDSGLVGFITYTVFIVGGLLYAFPGAGLPGTRSADGNASGNSEAWLVFAVWLGVLGWALQGLFEFGLYLPALAWTALALLGWLLGRAAVQPRMNTDKHG